MHPLADLGAGADQGVRVDHGAFVHIGADVDEHGGHADHRRCDIRAFPHRRSAGNHAHSVSDRELAGGESVFVDEGKGRVSHFAEFSQAKAQQNALFHPGVDFPLSVDLFGGANFSLRELLAEIEESLARFGIAFYLAQRGKALDGRLEGGHEKGSIEERISDCRF